MLGLGLVGLGLGLFSALLDMFRARSPMFETLQRRNNNHCLKQIYFIFAQRQQSFRPPSGQLNGPVCTDKHDIAITNELSRGHTIYTPTEHLPLVQ